MCSPVEYRSGQRARNHIRLTNMQKVSVPIVKFLSRYAAKFRGVEREEKDEDF